jgi:hypothetical protein
MCVDDGETLFLNHPRRLKLQLYCTPKHLERHNGRLAGPCPSSLRGNISRTDNVIAALEQSNIYRVCQVELVIAVGGTLEEVLARDAGVIMIPGVDMDLRLWSHASVETLSVMSRSRFVPGWICPTSANAFELNWMAFHFRDCQNYFCLLITLSNLWLSNIPHSGYFSPEAMVAPLSVLSSQN